MRTGAQSCHVWGQSVLGSPGRRAVCNSSCFPICRVLACWGLGWPRLCRSPEDPQPQLAGAPWEKSEGVPSVQSLWGTSCSSGTGLVLGTRRRESWQSLWCLPAPHSRPRSPGLPRVCSRCCLLSFIWFKHCASYLPRQLLGEESCLPRPAHRLRVHVVYRHVDTGRDKGQVDSLRSLTT